MIAGRAAREQARTLGGRRFRCFPFPRSDMQIMLADAGRARQSSAQDTWRAQPPSEPKEGGCPVGEASGEWMKPPVGWLARSVRVYVASLGRGWPDGCWGSNGCRGGRRCSPPPAPGSNCLAPPSARRLCRQPCETRRQDRNSEKELDLGLARLGWWVGCWVRGGRFWTLCCYCSRSPHPHHGLASHASLRPCIIRRRRQEKTVGYC